MTRGEYIEIFSWLGQILKDFTHLSGRGEKDAFKILEESISKAAAENPWFTRKNILYSLDAWSNELTRVKLERWLEPYAAELDKEGRSVNTGVVMAGNIPLVGFHDFLCVLVSGHVFQGRLSHKDAVLLPALTRILVSEYPQLQSRISFTDGLLKGQEAIIATGSTNTSHYFEYYFGKYPHIIRKNRKSVAIITGQETSGDLEDLGKDVFLYFGLGCRSVSTVYLPRGYDLRLLCDSLTGFPEVMDHSKYMNNYEYQRSVFLASGIPFLENGSIIFVKSGRVSSPVAVLQYEYYDNMETLKSGLESIRDDIQCIVSKEKAPFRWCLPGQSQHPALDDYADGVDTLKFLLALKEK